jgi:hypothetical protein
MFSNFFFLESCAVYDNVEKYGTAEQTTDESMAQVHCICIPRATNTEWIIVIAFWLHQWFHESASMLHYTSITFRLN